MIVLPWDIIYGLSVKSLVVYIEFILPVIKTLDILAQQWNSDINAHLFFNIK